MDKRSVLFIGGDERQLHCAKNMYDAGYETGVFGFEMYPSIPRELLVYTNLKIAVLLADVIVLPTPFLINSYLFAPFCKEKIKKEEILKYIDSKKIVFGGKFDADFADSLTQRHIEYYDFLTDESVILQNALLTAEGAVALMMQNSKKALFGKKVLILGYGRIAKSLSRLLEAFKMNIYVAARKKADLTRIKLSGFHACNIRDKINLNEYDFVINTVPAAVLNQNKIETYSGVFIDLAPVYTVHSPSYHAESGVPGKYAAIDAGKVCGEFAMQKLTEVEHA